MGRSRRGFRVVVARLQLCMTTREDTAVPALLLLNTDVNCPWYLLCSPRLRVMFV